MNYRLKYESVGGELKNAAVEASSLPDAVSKVKDMKTLFYYMETSDKTARPADGASKRDWAYYLLPEPHLTRFLGMDFDDGDYLESPLPHDAVDTDDHARNSLVDKAFTWEATREGDDYWEAVYEGQFGEAHRILLKKALERKSSSWHSYILPGDYSIPA